MDEKALREFLRRLNIRAGRANANGWIPFPCALARWTHKNGRDSRASAAARIAPNGVSSFVCQGCHAHGRIAKLINLLASYRKDDSLRPMMVEADRADAQCAISAGFGEFDLSQDIESIEPLMEEQYAGIYPAATAVREAESYLGRRGIEGWAADNMGLLWDSQKRRILFPIRDNNNALYGFSGRAIDPDKQPKIRDYFGLPKRHLILGEHEWVEERPLIVVEGLFGYANLYQECGGIANIGALLGSFLTPQKAERIIRLNEPTYLLLDPDQGGDLGLFGTITPEGIRENNGAIAQLAGHLPLFVPEWPAGIEDPDQLTRAHIEKIIEETPLFSPTGNSTFDKVWDRWQ